MTTLEVNFIFWTSRVINENWLKLKIKPPVPTLACLNRRNFLYQLKSNSAVLPKDRSANINSPPKIPLLVREDFCFHSKCAKIRFKVQFCWSNMVYNGPQQHLVVRGTKFCFLWSMNKFKRLVITTESIWKINRLHIEVCFAVILINFKVKVSTYAYKRKFVDCWRKKSKKPDENK